MLGELVRHEPGDGRLVVGSGILVRGSMSADGADDLGGVHSGVTLRWRG